MIFFLKSEESVRESLCNLGVSKIIHRQTQNALTINEKANKLHFPQIKNFFSSKTPLTKFKVSHELRENIHIT